MENKTEIIRPAGMPTAKEVMGRSCFVELPEFGEVKLELSVLGQGYLQDIHEQFSSGKLPSNETFEVCAMLYVVLVGWLVENNKDMTLKQFMARSSLLKMSNEKLEEIAKKVAWVFGLEEIAKALDAKPGKKLVEDAVKSVSGSTSTMPSTGPQQNAVLPLKTSL